MTFAGGCGEAVSSAAENEEAPDRMGVDTPITQDFPVSSRLSMAIRRGAGSKKTTSTAHECKS